MGTRQFYYKDPLKAAYMCQEHGLTYIDERGEPYGTPSMVLVSYSKPRPHKHIIAPLRLRLLEPRIRDKCQLGKDSPYSVNIVSLDDFQSLKTEAESDRDAAFFIGQIMSLPDAMQLPLGDLPVERRSGKPFFWPECEE